LRAIPLILKYQGTGHIYAVAEEEDIEAQLLDMDSWVGYSGFCRRWHSQHSPDWRHKSIENRRKERTA